MRRAAQFFFASIFLVLFVQTRYPAPEARHLDLFLLFTPLLPFVAVTGLLFGRGFCSWVCPMGALIDIGNRIFGPGTTATTYGWCERLRPVPIVLFIFLMVPLLFGINIVFFLDPLALFNRILTVVLFPLFTWFIPGVLHLFGIIPGLAGVSSGMQSAWERWIVPEGPNMLIHIWPVALLLAVIWALEFASPRFWCRFICPAGTLLGRVSRGSRFGRRVSETCVKCGNCHRICPMGAIPAGAFDQTRPEVCTNCLDCAKSCPGEVAAISFGFGSGAGKHLPSPPLVSSRRNFIGAVAGGIVTTGLFKAGLSNRDDSAQLIRPPGALPESTFLLLCVKCMACVRVCRSNGGCLQPGQIHGSLLELWSPEAVMRSGYCEFNCNLCGRACLSGAIRRLPIAEKQKTCMGQAFFRKDICIPHNRHEDCLVCEEHCPVPDKAIKFENREFTKPDGSAVKVKLPYVDRKLCIGCGICENKCPLPGQGGIYVTGEDARRSKGKMQSIY
ncbi:MAG: 4Fe-4S binding protein [Candidatus Riflebacteria bacterium]|nr:4Fe-4S binding protein [Candidatus Riflebacteria bacterium]